MFQNPFKKLLRHWKVIVVGGLIGALFSLVITLLFPLKYRADAQVLIISKSRSGVDPYTIVKSAERVGENLAQIIRTTDFYTKVRTAEGYGINWDNFDALTERQRRRLWRRTVEPNVVYGSGVLGMSVYHEDLDVALRMVGAAANVLVQRGWEYVGGDVTIKIVNNPIVTRFPVKPNVPLNVLLGFLIGMLVGTAFALRFQLQWREHFIT